MIRPVQGWISGVMLHDGLANEQGNAQSGQLLRVHFSVPPLRSLCLCGECCRAFLHHGDTEDTKIAQREELELSYPRVRLSYGEISLLFHLVF
jgi:hypothetical protein